MLRHPEYTSIRITKLINDLKSHIHTDTRALDQLLISPPVGRIPFDEAKTLDYTPVKLGQQLGPFWQTFWFKASTSIPASQQNKQVDLIFDTQSEAALYLDDHVTQGLNPGRHAATLTPSATADQSIDFYIEVACNQLFGSRGQVYKTLAPYVLEQAHTAVFNPETHQLYYDLLVLNELQQQPDLDPTFAGLLLYQLNEICNIIDPADPETFAPASQIIDNLYQNRNASTVHQLSAVGHAHMDTAWLWPIEETWRKCARTFSTAVRYMDQYPDYKFACSQACQYEQIENRHPDLFQRIKQKASEGQWIPVGGTWVEADCNIPSGESLCRQFLIGQRYFKQHFGAYCREHWIPDVFGYNGQLPQIMKLAGIEFFLTQKLSWNAFNKPLYQTFNWQGIDGSTILTHFPPANTYNAVATVKELRDNVRNYKENDRSRHSLLVFGIGDGGGGPTIDMLERLSRAKDLQGLPQTTMESPVDFFEKLKKDCIDLPIVVGELYFELHRGTYTTHAAVKQNNRRCEFLLHDIETLASLAHRLNNAPYPIDELTKLWKLLLVNQFHDIIPGSSIPEVYIDAANDYQTILQDGKSLLDTALKSLAEKSPNEPATPFNTTSFPRFEVTQTPAGQTVYITTPSFGPGQITTPNDKVTLTESSDHIILENQHLSATITRAGTLVSLIHKATDRESLDTAASIPANQFILFRDNPPRWPAWDIDPTVFETAKPTAPASSYTITEQSDLRCDITFTHPITDKSTITQTIRLNAAANRIEFHTHVDWHDTETLLKVAFPLAVRAMNATYEMQFGFVERPTHYNNTHALAQYEVPGHRFADLAEHNFGVALLSDSKYGYHTYQNTMHLTLLRSPQMPNCDQYSDQGEHHFAYALMPHTDTWQNANVVAEALHFNTQPLWSNIKSTNESFFKLDTSDLVLDTVKKAEDSSAILLRFYEAHGSRGRATLTTSIPFESATKCNILEQPAQPIPVNGNQVTIDYQPHQIINLLLD